MKEVKIGFIGAGAIAGHHANRLSKISGAKIVAAADIDLEKARSFTEKYGGTPYRDWREMLEREELDAVYVCLPPFAHSDEVVVAAEKGMHVFIEKPIALELETALKMQRAVEKAGVISWVGYQQRQAYSVRLVKKLLEEEGGRVGLLRGRWWGTVVLGKKWWRVRELSGGQIIEQVTHIYDLARFFCGEVKKVYAEVDTLFFKDLEDYTIEDVGAAILRFENGAIGVITNTTGARPNACRVDLEIVARNLQAEVSAQRAKIYSKGGVVEVESLNDPMYDEDYKFIKAVAEGGESEVPIGEGVKTLRLTLAVFKAFEEGRPVEL